MSRIEITPSQLARLTGVGKNNSIMDLVCEYKTLKLQLAEADDQSVYFKWGIDNHRQRLKEVRREYQSAKSFINNHSAAELGEMISNKDRIIAKVKLSEGSRFIRALALNALQSHRDKLVDYLDIKQKFGALPSIETFINIKEGLWN